MKWLRRSANEPLGKPFTVDPTRYTGRPLLILLDNYILSVIGCLEPDREAEVGALVVQTFGGGLDWRATLRAQVHLPETLDARIRSMWKQQPKGADPMAFMVAVSDANFLPMIDPIDPAGDAGATRPS